MLKKSLCWLLLHRLWATGSELPCWGSVPGQCWSWHRAGASVSDGNLLISFFFFFFHAHLRYSGTSLSLWWWVLLRRKSATPRKAALSCAPWQEEKSYFLNVTFQQRQHCFQPSAPCGFHADSGGWNSFKGPMTHKQHRASFKVKIQPESGTLITCLMLFNTL